MFVKDGDLARMTEVKTGISDYDNIEIVSGLKKDAEIVVGPFLVVSKRLKDGDKIKLREVKEADKKP